MTMKSNRTSQSSIFNLPSSVRGTYIMSEIGFGIIGCGNISSIHAKAIQAVPDARLRAFYSHSQPKAEKMAQQYGVEFESNLDRFLERPDIQVVSICTPSGTHADLGIKAAAAGKHVVVETHRSTRKPEC
jgi:predicted dehydrogenase